MTVLKVPAEWKGGRVLRDVERHQGERTDITSRQADAKSAGYLAFLGEAGLSEPMAHRWQTIAAVPEAMALGPAGDG